MTVVYVDILLAINLTVDYLVLFGTARLSGIQFVRLKGLLGAAVGAIYSMIIFIDMPRGFFVLTKLIASAIMVLITFGKRKLWDFIRILMIFYICGFLFFGFMMFINSAVHANSFFLKGGIVYFEISAMGIVMSSTAAFLITEITRRLFRRGEPEGAFMAKIFYGEKTTVLKGFTDTGNSLSDPISGAPVAVATVNSLRKILPKDMCDAIKNSNLSTEHKLRFIPCKTVSGSVLMLAFRPEKVLIKNEKGEFEAEDVMIAFSESAPENTLIIGKNIILKEKGKIFSEV